MDAPAVNLRTDQRSPLHADLVEMLQATRAAERDLFGMLPVAVRDAHGSDGGWSPKDILGHLAAWRAIEARRLEASIRGEGGGRAGDPAPNDPIDESNAMLHARYAEFPWEAVAHEADASLEALVDAIGRSSSDALCECDGTIAGIGANGANHALGHLTDMTTLAGGQARFDAFAGEIEGILRRGHIPPRDSGVILYNVACHRALIGELDEARRLLRAAFARRHDLLELARQDSDLAVLRAELATLAEVKGRASGT